MRDKIEVPAELFKELCQRSADFARERWSFDPLEDKARPYLALCELPRFSIHVTRWFNSRSGTTYGKFYIYADATSVCESSQFSGYGDHGLYEAMRWLLENRPEWVPGYERNSSPTIWLREHQCTWVIGDVTRERNL